MNKISEKSITYEEIRDNFEYVLSNFQFYKVYMTMHNLGWTWAGSYLTPSINDMEETVKELFENALMDRFENGRRICESGGFRVEIYEDGVVNIEFIVEQSSSIGNK